MTYDEIIALKPKQMNQIVWWKIFGMPDVYKNDMRYLIDYCGNESAAFTVIEKLRKDYSYSAQSGHNGLHIFSLFTQCGDAKSYRATSDSFPMAVCRAALMAIFDIETPFGR